MNRTHDAPLPRRAPRPARHRRPAAPWSATSAPATRCRRASTSARRSTSRSAWRPRSASTTSCPSEDRRWLERSRAALPDRVRPAVDDELCIFGTGLIIDRPDVTDAAAFVELHPRQTPAPEFAQRRPRRPAPRRHARGGRSSAALDGDRTAIDADPRALARAQARLAAAASSATPTAITRGGHRPADGAWLPLYQEIEPRVQRSSSATSRLRAGRPHARSARPSSSSARPTASAGCPSRASAGVVLAPSYLAPPVQLHVQRPATGGCSSTRSRTRPSSRTTRSPRRSACCASTGPWATTPGSGSCACCATATGT